MLCHLAKMRRSEMYGSLASFDGMERLAEKYGIELFLSGDQDWMTLLGWEMEDMIHLIPCQFNRQIQAYINDEFSCFDTNQAMYDLYHKCDAKSKIIHWIGD